MMINCPNCNLLQPKDQYCAGCGINIETWKPPEPPVWKKLVSNWMFQLTLLFLIIFAIVLKDNLSQKSLKQEVQNNMPVAESIPRVETQNFAEPPQIDNQEPNEKKVVKIKSASPQTKLIPETALNKKPIEIKKIANLKISFMNQQMLFQLTEKAQKISDHAFIVPLKRLNEVLGKNTNHLKSFGSISSDFAYNKEKLLFVGEEDLETGLKIGLFTMISVLPFNPDKPLQYEFSYWSQLQLSREANNRVSFEVTAPTDSVLIFIDPTINEIVFNKDERALFESSDRLIKLNSEVFQEGLSDIVLVLEIK